MKIYHFKQDTNEYIGETKARIDPLETTIQGREVYLLPANATTIKPPAVPSGMVAVKTESGWITLNDNRGKSYWLPDGTYNIIADIGVDVPEGALDEPPKPTAEMIAAAEREAKISAEMRAVAIERLKASGELPPNYKDSVVSGLSGR